MHTYIHTYIFGCLCVHTLNYRECAMSRSCELQHEGAVRQDSDLGLLLVSGDHGLDFFQGLYRSLHAGGRDLLSNLVPSLVALGASTLCVSACRFVQPHRAPCRAPQTHLNTGLLKFSHFFLSVPSANFAIRASMASMAACMMNRCGAGASLPEPRRRFRANSGVSVGTAHCGRVSLQRHTRGVRRGPGLGKDAFLRVDVLA
jgi:hypothetical protein